MTRLKTPKHRELSSRVLTQLSAWGFPPDVQQRIGALTVVWGIFETNLETTLWALRDEKVTGVRPSTDRMQISQLIDAMSENSRRLSPEAQEVLQYAALAAKDLMEYRHAMMHGWLLPSPTMPTFIRNPRWNGEQRSRPSNDAHVDENLLDMAIDSAWILYRVICEARSACVDPKAAVNLTALKPDALRARSQANELRHLTSLMNNENY